MSLAGELNKLRVEKKTMFNQGLKNFKEFPRVSEDSVAEQYERIANRLKEHCTHDYIELLLTSKDDESATLVDMLIKDGITNFSCNKDFLCKRYGLDCYTVGVKYPFDGNPLGL